MSKTDWHNMDPREMTVVPVPRYRRHNNELRFFRSLKIPGYVIYGSRLCDIWRRECDMWYDIDVKECFEVNDLCGCSLQSI